MKESPTFPAFDTQNKNRPKINTNFLCLPLNYRMASHSHPFRFFWTVTNRGQHNKRRERLTIDWLQVYRFLLAVSKTNERTKMTVGKVDEQPRNPVGSSLNGFQRVTDTLHELRHVIHLFSSTPTNNPPQVNWLGPTFSTLIREL
jgi:hypothetical protein